VSVSILDSVEVGTHQGECQNVLLQPLTCLKHQSVIILPFTAFHCY